MKKIAFVVALIAIAFGYIIHHPIPAKVQDPILFQVLTDILAFSETMGKVAESLGFNRWWAYPGAGKIPLPTFLNVPDGMIIEKHMFHGVESVLVIPEGFKEREKPGPAIVMYHGGGWVFGNVDLYLPLLVSAAEETGFLVMSPEYRLAPEHAFPVPFEDCLNSTLEFLNRAKEFNVNPEKISLSGDSAGGNLAMAVTVELVKRKAAGLQVQTPAMQALIYPKLQMINYLLPSYVQNREFMFSKDLIPKFFLSYIGLSSKYPLAEVICENGHLDFANQKIAEKFDLVGEAKVPARFKKRLYDPTPALIPSEAKKLLDAETKSFLIKMMLDERIAPLLISDEVLKKLPYTHTLVCEYDPLRDDGIILHERLKYFGKKTTLQHLPESLHAAASIGPLSKDLYHAEQNRIFFRKIKDHLEN